MLIEGRYLTVDCGSVQREAHCGGSWRWKYIYSVVWRFQKAVWDNSAVDSGRWACDAEVSYLGRRYLWQKNKHLH